MFIKLLFNSFPIVFLSIVVNSQVCIKQIYVTKLVPRTYQFMHYVTYRERCNSFGGWCVNSRWETKIKEKHDEQTTVKSVEYCCDGYKRDDFALNDGNIKCRPICEPACENSYCTYPGNCKCFEGYTRHEQNNHTCVLFCENGCGNGTCIKPNTCLCNLGYELVNGTCQPVCRKPCHNGICVSPDMCECLPGYRKFWSDICEPHCSKGCHSGRCIAPDKCHCYAGYVLEENINRCVIKCSLLNNFDLCGKGTCEASHLCRCFPGYRPDYSHKRSFLDVRICTPIDTITSVSSTTSERSTTSETNTTPETSTTTEMNTIPKLNTTLETWPRYLMRTTTSSPSLSPETTVNDTILRNCDINPCGNGTCISSNLCKCFNGYTTHYMRLWGFTDGPVCVPKCNECKGSDCVAPNKCVKREVSTMINENTTSSTTETSITIEKSTNATSILAKSRTIYKTSTTSLSTPYKNYESDINNTDHYFVPNNGSEGITKDNAMEISWMQQHKMTILIPLLVVVTTGIIILLVWRRALLLNLFQKKSYVIEGTVPKNVRLHTLEDIQLFSTNKDNQESTEISHNVI